MRPTLLLPVCLLAAGCATSNTHRLDQAARQPRSPGSVQLFFEKPRVRYVVISFVEATGDPALKNLEDLQQELINKAARIGGDGVIIRSEDTYLGSTPAGNGRETLNRRRLFGDVIVFDRSG